jgi:hypothetical protein
MSNTKNTKMEIANALEAVLRLEFRGRLAPYQ